MTTPRLADRAYATDVSGIRKMFDLARTMKNPINLSIGQPDFVVPENIKLSAQNAIAENRNSYTPTQGCAELINAVSEKFGGRYANDQIIITSAVSGGLNLGYLALLNPNDEILIPDPYFLMYKQLALLIGAKPIFVDTYPDFSLHPERFAEKITAKTRAIVLGSPVNPTGAVYNENDWRQLADLARAHNLIIIFDAIYATFCYDAPNIDPTKFYPEGILYLGGFSKSHALTGWRLGYAVGEKTLIQTMAKFQQFTFVCAPAPLQYAAVEALKTPMNKFTDEYKKRRDFIYAGLISAGYRVEKPQGAFYIFPQIPDRYANAEAFVAEAIKHELMIVAGNIFSERNRNFRISYATSMEQLQRGLDVLKKLNR